MRRPHSLLLCTVTVLAGCPSNEPLVATGELEIGVDDGGTFRPLVPGDTITVVLGANGLNMIQPSLRAVDINPRSPDPAVDVDVGGFVMAADIAGSRVDMQHDGTGFVLWNLQVPFQTDLCCYACGMGLVRAGIRDASGRLFEGSVMVRLERGGCPDEEACCTSADACPDPSLTVLCDPGAEPPEGATLNWGPAGGAMCSVPPRPEPSSPGPWALLLLAVALLTRRARRRWAPALGAALIAACALLAPNAAEAQDGVALDAYHPAETAGDGFALSQVRGQGHMRFGAQLHIDYANDPLVVELREGDRSTEVFAIVADHLVAHVALSLGVADRVVIYAGLPVHLLMAGDDGPLSSTVGTADGSGVGDVLLGVRWAALGDPDGIWGLGLSLTATAPLAEAADSGQRFSGNPGFTLQPELLGELRPAGVHIVGNLGVRLRDKTRMLDLEIGNELTWGIGLAVPVLTRRAVSLWGHLEMVGATSLENFPGREESPVEALLGAKLHTTDGITAGLAAGPGLSRGYGAPDVRFVAMFGYTMPEPEPEPEPEVVPEPPRDSDDDGIYDEQDACPDVAEDRDEFEDFDGCPEADNDADGVLDPEDGCPNEAEDRDEFEDADGCPDPDNDRDEILDGDDGCPNEAEDADGYEDGDGCPDPDNDQDTVPDTEDECPLAPGTPEARGCPRAVRLDTVTGQIVILERVEFATNRDTILRGSEPLLEEVRATIAANAQLRVIRVEGHTDDRGRDAHNLDLSRRRAASVIRWFVEHGIAAERLEGQGCGELHPLVENTNRANRQTNRRVEFHLIDPPPSRGARNLEGCAAVEPPAAPAE